MISIGNEVKAQIKTFKESLGLTSRVQPSNLSMGNTPFLTYIDDTLGERTVTTFIYGVSEYGGEDIIVSSSPDRKVFRKFLEMK